MLKQKQKLCLEIFKISKNFPFQTQTQQIQLGLKKMSLRRAVGIKKLFFPIADKYTGLFTQPVPTLLK